MGIEIRELRRRDYGRAIQFAITGMHFNLYLDNKLLLNLYGRYFWYSELNSASQVIAAYDGEKLAGVLLADMQGEEKKYKTTGQTAYVKIFEFLQNTFYRGGVGIYDEANRELLDAYLKENNPDGQVVFLAADPDAKVRGIGSRLLEELERRIRGKEIYLYTDDACTYQFYEHRGFQKSGEKEILMDLTSKKVPLKCFLYSKRIS
ncbi:GNAT family N-acetyltransferase [Emergencia sp.]|uniref:GNAT family N-acetyltransferase n=1 Tax=Emergencia sp. TaxID=1926557 RepID=UPI003AF01211